MSNPQARQNLVDCVTALRQAQSDFLWDSLNGFDLYEGWAEEDPRSYRDFVQFCVDHPTSEAREFIAGRGDYLLETEPTFTVDVYRRLLRDTSQTVRFGALENIDERLTDLTYEAENGIMKTIGLNGLRALLVDLAEVAREKATKHTRENIV